MPSMSTSGEVELPPKELMPRMRIAPPSSPGAPDCVGAGGLRLRRGGCRPAGKVTGFSWPGLFEWFLYYYRWEPLSLRLQKYFNNWLRVSLSPECNPFFIPWQSAAAAKACH